MLKNCVPPAVFAKRWLILGAALAVAAVVYVVGTWAIVPIWSGSASIQMGRMVTIATLLDVSGRGEKSNRVDETGEADGVFELIEKSADVARRLSFPSVREELFVKSGLSPARDRTEWQLFRSSFRGIEITNQFLRIEATAESREHVVTLLSSAVNAILERHRQIAEQRTALTEHVLADVEARLAALEADSRQLAQRIQSTPTASDSVLATAMLSNGMYASLRDLFSTRLRLRIAVDTQRPTRIIEPVEADFLPRHAGRIYLSLLAGLGTLAAVILFTTLYQRRTVRPRRPST